METAEFRDDSIARVPVSAWEKLSSKRIYFGHQSVGYNIMQGVQEIKNDAPAIRLNVLDLKEKMAPGSGGVFAHGTVGKNQQPSTKLEDFKKNLQGVKGNDIAFLKFCYVDIVEKTDVRKLFADYKAGMEEIKARHPGMVVVHMTVPLTADRPSIKNTIKRILGRSSNCAENAKKNEYNEMLLKEFGDKEPIFDLAKIESTHADGTRVTCSENGKTYFYLNPDYTDDGGHLNGKGRKVVASKLLIFLSDLAEKN
ncbi:MAG: hypothetical protein HZB37_02280 [Planctomycetes bacterium]|nr:hypothetical protein [Planctomycetota bacterium]